MQPNAGRQASVAFEIRRRFRCPRETVFRAWTQPEALRRWWCPSGWVPEAIELDLRVAGAYRIGMRRDAMGSRISVRGHFLEVRPPERLKFTWRWEGAFEMMPETVVTIEFLEFAGGTELTLRHENFADPDIGRQHRSGWIAACARLDQAVMSSSPAAQVS
jgi:uncharacterized protein YndB with AHSA1/START domain